MNPPIKPGDRVTVVSDSSTYHRQVGTALWRLRRNVWMVKIDGDEKFDEVSFGEWELEIANEKP